MNYDIKIAHNTNTIIVLKLTIMSIIQSRHDLEVSPNKNFFIPICSLSLKIEKKAIQSQVQRGQKHIGKACSSSTGVKVLLKVTPSFFLPRQTHRVQTTRFQNILASPRFPSPLQADVLDLSANTFHQGADLRSDPLAECKKAPNICTLPSSHQSRLTVLARDGASRRARPNVLRRLAAVQRKLR